MAKLYACIASGGDKAVLISIAEKFAYNIELKNDAVLFDISGLEKRLGSPAKIANSIAKELQDNDLAGNVAISRNAGSAILHAQSKQGITVSLSEEPEPLPLSSFDLNPDTLTVFQALGIKTTSDLRRIPENELIARYGLEFRNIVDLINERGKYILTPNLRENKVSWNYELDFSVTDTERLIFILGRGLGRLFEQTSQFGFSTEQIDIIFGLDDKSIKRYELKVSFPSLDNAFWLKLLNLRIANEPPKAAINTVTLICYFTRPRAVQRGLYSAARPEPESLLLTVAKIKKLVGEKNVGVPALLDQRVPKAFSLDADKLPVGREAGEIIEPLPMLAFNYFDPPLSAETTIHKGALIYLRTPYFKGRVIEYGGVWKESSQWWNPLFWQTSFWDVELENRSIYRLSKHGNKWLVTGEYD
ncbi:MAG: hypothetical protein ACR2IH_01710 [Pyrinomonadaceae bacterium]